MFNRIYNTDCREGMKSIPSDTIDLVITDPPFGIDLTKKQSGYNRDLDLVIGGYFEIPTIDYYKFTYQWLVEVRRILKESGSVYVFSGWNHLKDILMVIDDLNFIMVNHIIWKYQFGMVTTRKYVTSHYHCLYICKNDKKRKFFPYCRYNKDDKNDDGRSLHYQDKEDVWYIQREYWRGLEKTPTKLPSEIIEKFLSYSSEEGDIVLDPFLGSGSVAVVSKRMNRQYIGYEIVKAYYDFATKRLE